jgi:NarL family two-component system response regulator LiaR
MIRVLICDDQAVVRDGLAAILSTDDEIEVVGIARHGEEALSLAAEFQPDVVLMDLKMPVMNGVHATERLRARQPATRVLVLTTYADDAWVFDAVRAGASGYLLKDTRRDDLLAAIKGTAAGKTFLDPAIAGKVLARAVAPAEPAKPSTELLTERDLDVLRLICRGYSNPEIAQQLHLAAGTVRNYVSTILQKLDVEDRTQAAVAAYERGLVQKSESFAPKRRTR